MHESTAMNQRTDYFSMILKKSLKLNLRYICIYIYIRKFKNASCRREKHSIKHKHLSKESRKSRILLHVRITNRYLVGFDERSEEK